MVGLKNEVECRSNGMMNALPSTSLILIGFLVRYAIVNSERGENPSYFFYLQKYTIQIQPRDYKSTKKRVDFVESHFDLHVSHTQQANNIQFNSTSMSRYSVRTYVRRPVKRYTYHYRSYII